MKTVRWVWLTLAAVVTGAPGAPSNVVPPPNMIWSGLEEPLPPPPPPHHARAQPKKAQASPLADPNLYQEFQEFLEWKKTHP